MEKAAVLPVPVWAAPMTSRPASTTGMALAWMGDIVGYSMALSSLGLSGRVSKRAGASGTAGAASAVTEGEAAPAAGCVAGWMTGWLADTGWPAGAPSGKVA